MSIRKVLLKFQFLGTNKTSKQVSAEAIICFRNLCKNINKAGLDPEGTLMFFFKTWYLEAIGMHAPSCAPYTMANNTFSEQFPETFLRSHLGVSAMSGVSEICYFSLITKFTIF